MSPNTKKHNVPSGSRFARVLTSGKGTPGRVVQDARGNQYTVHPDGSLRLPVSRARRGRGKSARRLMIRMRKITF